LVASHFDSSIAAIVPFHSSRLILYQPTIITIRMVEVHYHLEPEYTGL
jgi:hypothetical protein